MRVVSHAHSAHRLAVLLIKEGIGTSGDRLLHRHLGDRDRNVLPNGALHLRLHRIALLARQRTIEWVVKPQVFRMHQRAALLRIRPCNDPDRPMEQVCRRMVAHRRGTPRRINTECH